MSEEGGHTLVERTALALQDLYRERGHGGWNTLIRIDNRAEAAAAPYRFDAAHGMLHRRDCRALSEDARSASYALWRIGPEDRIKGCKRCMPMPEERTRNEEQAAQQAKAGPDLLFGLVSILDQFGGVLQERGKDYRKTEEGRKIGAEMARFYQALGQREKRILDTALASLELLIGRVREAEEQMKGRRGQGNG